MRAIHIDDVPAAAMALNAFAADNPNMYDHALRLMSLAQSSADGHPVDPMYIKEIKEIMEIYVPKSNKIQVTGNSRDGYTIEHPAIGVRGVTYRQVILMLARLMGEGDIAVIDGRDHSRPQIMQERRDTR